MKVLVTGGAGYIGSTICSALSDNGHGVVVLDSLVKGSPTFITDKIFYRGDISDKEISVLKRKAKGLGIKEDELEYL